jgi:hypothetical protein
MMRTRRQPNQPTDPPRQQNHEPPPHQRHRRRPLPSPDWALGGAWSSSFLYKIGLKIGYVSCACVDVSCPCPRACVWGCFDVPHSLFLANSLDMTVKWIVTVIKFLHQQPTIHHCKTIYCPKHVKLAPYYSFSFLQLHCLVTSIQYTCHRWHYCCWLELREVTLISKKCLVRRCRYQRWCGSNSQKCQIYVLEKGHGE